MQGFQINSVSAPPGAIEGQTIPPTGTGGWGRDCAPDVAGTKVSADPINDILGNLLRVLQVARVDPTANRYDDLVEALENLYRGPSSDVGNVLLVGADGKPLLTLDPAPANMLKNGPRGLLVEIAAPDLSGYVQKASVGQSDGVASLDADARVPVTELPVGDAPNHLVQLDSAGKLPALDGSQLINLPPVVTPENLVLNGNFAINQRRYVSGAASSLGSSSYRHDGWRFGSYTFEPSTEDPRDTIVTITGATPLNQVIAGLAVAGGTYTLSWTGSALGRLAVGANVAPTGVPQPSPIVVNNVNQGAGFQIDFQPGGTLGNVQLIPGSVVLPFQRLPFEVELIRCYRTSFVIYASQGNSVLGMGYVYGGGTNVILVGSFPFPMSGPPSFQGGGYENIAGDRFNAGSVTGVTPQLKMNDFSTVRGFELNIAISTSISSGLAMGIYTTNAVLANPTYFLFES
jgi:hypothetical protein